MAKISKITAREVFDSRANPTVEVKLTLDSGIEVVDSAPSGVGESPYEAVEVRDNDPKRLRGLGVLKAIENVTQKIAPKLVGMDPCRQRELDEIMIQLDGTDNKRSLGANAILPVSMCIAKAGAIAQSVPLYEYINSLTTWQLPQHNFELPVPMFNVINGGRHGAGNLDFQEFLLIPARSKSYHESLWMSVEVYRGIKDVLTYRNAIHSVGDEGGFAPDLFTNTDAFEIIMQAIAQTQYKFSYDVFLGLDVAAFSFKQDGRYRIKDSTEPMTANQMIKYYKQIIDTYHLLSIEDPLGPEDWKDWAQLTQLIGDEALVVADDLVVTNPIRLEKAISQKSANALLVKPNQLGTLTETIAVIKTAREADWKIVVSHRSGETNDSFIADFSVGICADFVKFGAPARGERLAKYNRLLEIEEELAVHAE